VSGAGDNPAADVRFGFLGIQLAAVERASGMATHVGLSLMVLQVWMRGGLRWLFLAITLHFAVNAIAATLVHQLEVQAAFAELAVAAMAAAVLFLGWKLAEVGQPTAGSSGFSGSP
jgi:uncharacterized membrane protein YhfC